MDKQQTDQHVAEFLGVDTEFIHQAGDMAYRRTQDIDDGFLRRLRNERQLQDRKFAPEMLKVASIPCEKWLREGFDVHKAPLKDVVRKLRTEGLEDFIVTSKRVH